MIVAISTMLPACGQTTNWLKGRISDRSDKGEILGAPAIDVYVQELGKIAAGDPAAQAEIYADAHAAASLTPSPSTNLRLGLVLAIPGHPESNPQEAQRLLREVLTQTVLLTPAEVSMATIHLNSVERQIVADAEVRRMRASTSRVTQTQEQAISQRLATVEAENRQLRRELEEAEAKLEAITSIERSIREHE
ncbi:MAG TPA: hypothetical protein PKH39_04195 [Woeseiaceae bacterium]|nr:hypothetical protein [Woeseiaceae bacterium]